MENDFKKGLHFEPGEYKLAPFYYDGEEEQDVIIEKTLRYVKEIEDQYHNFINYIKYMNHLLCVLKHYGIVSDYTRFLARIKGVQSALKNDDKKALNDIFGVDIQAGTEGEIVFISELFNSTLNITRDIVHNKDNGYEAHHISGFAKKSNLIKTIKELLENQFDREKMLNIYNSNLTEKDKKNDKEEQAKKYLEKYMESFKTYIERIKRTLNGVKLDRMLEELSQIEQKFKSNLKENDPYQPIIECQLKTIAVAINANYGSANHEAYKGEEIEEIQEEYDKNGKLKPSKLPFLMLRSNLGTDKNGNPKPFKKLTEDEMIKALYPSIILNSREEREI